MENSIEIFKNVVFHLRDWYMKENNIVSIEDFNRNNDFSILKLIKLHFFVIAINSDKDDLLLNENEFWAMPYGPVETTVYTRIRINKNFNEFILSNDNITFTGNKPLINQNVESKILSSIEILMELEPRLVFADAGTLVDLSHKWNCWRKNYMLARARNSYSSIIPKEDITKDIKVINLDLV
ncbi:hypothetical protein KBJ98_13855 [Flavobacterium sp. F-328]|uniref:Antitoxin SocA-like Panacea domain-containing protein n=1 Tax=Flavobacterium erciyesense TaxID=2825842 RepID=A0ABS5D6X8_9FLAO|nr:hypothetical protein [Flavobacterium erciyesense]MBQ0909794.1 hypothetical protein [Flavobacterium erciyesense]